MTVALAPGSRWLVVVAHPDDETLGCGALLARLPGAVVIHITDGAPRDAGDAVRHGFADRASYAAARWREARAALDLAGVPEERHHGFGIADQEAARHIAAVARRLAPFVARADTVLTHAYEGGHPDHDAVACAVHAAVALSGGTERSIVEMPFYHAGPEGWMRQRFLPRPVQDHAPLPARGDGRPSRPAMDRDAAEEQRIDLTPADIDLKRRMAGCHATQTDTLASFALDREIFRRAPSYDFTRLPHDGDLLYERHGWNLDRAGWRAAVAAARDDLGSAP